MTPLTRLTMALEAELELAKDPQMEADLAAKYLERVNETAQRRDATLKSLVVFDGLLAIAASGRNITVPGINISMADIPAILEGLIGITSASVYIFSFSFTTWLCYSQIHFVFSKRIAARHNLDPDLISFAQTASEPTLKMFRSKLNIWGEDWHRSGNAFSGMVAAYSISNNIFFIMAPLLHLSLMYYAASRMIKLQDFDFIHIVFYAWVVLAHVLAIFTWVVPSVPFSFQMDVESSQSQPGA
ncbi:hypothetical protein [Rhizobium ruizarguesonis]|uniref:hypothetical protein n=1 Tax=Rhizobium ruizarguesonis TaxID=2081791 RepID=UPI0013D61633|nr:hypothetical protein [Rhizobium ruizarguesonis]NEH81307.1 hypothetical protein [Rhizobium ruizarguesonis]